MMRRILPALLAAAFLLAACTPVPRPDPAPTPEPMPAGTSVHTMSYDGLDRSYRVYVPTTLTEGPSTLVVMLHGGFGSAEQAELTYGWDRQAEEDGFIVAYPEGVARSWNGGDCCGQAVARDVDDVGFVEAVVDAVDATLGIDPQRVFAAGMSNGGILAYRLACESDRFAAVGAVSATMLVDCDAPAPVSVLHVQGSLDASIPPDGSPGAGTQQIDGPPLADVIGYWATRDGCDGSLEGTYGDAEVRSWSAQDCDAGTAVRYLEIADAGHQWPGAPSSEIRDQLGGDPPSERMDATDALASFFAGHPRPE